METVISKATFEKVRDYSAKVNPTDEKRTIFQVGVKLPANVTQETFSTVVNYLVDQGFKNMGYRPELPNQLTWEVIFNAATGVSTREKLDDIDKAILKSWKNVLAALKAWQANGKLAKECKKRQCDNKAIAAMLFNHAKVGNAVLPDVATWERLVKNLDAKLTVKAVEEIELD